jgi:hypothetical protein
MKDHKMHILSIGVAASRKGARSNSEVLQKGVKKGVLEVNKMTDNIKRNRKITFFRCK